MAPARAQAGSLGSGALLGSLPIAAHAGAILHANNARDVDEDRANGVRTLPMALGPRGSYALYIALIALPFGASVASAWGRSALAAAPLLAAPTAAGLIRDFGAGKMARRAPHVLPAIAVGRAPTDPATWQAADAHRQVPVPLRRAARRGGPHPVATDRRPRAPHAALTVTSRRTRSPAAGCASRGVSAQRGMRAAR